MARNPWRLHGAFLFCYALFFEVCQGFFEKTSGRIAVRLIFLLFGNFEVGIGFHTSANPSANISVTIPSSGRRQGRHRSFRICGMLFSMPRFFAFCGESRRIS